MNSKIQMASVSLVGAIPGLCLSIVLVSALVSYFGKMSIMMTSLAGLTLLASVGLTMLPVVILVFSSKTVKDESKVDEKQSDAAAAAVAEKEELIAADDEQKLAPDEDATNKPDDSAGDDLAKPDGAADDVFMEGDEEEFDMGLFEDKK